MPAIDSKSSIIADFIVHHFHEHGDPITNLKLQKLLYYCQAWSLVINERELFPEDFEAWVHGPVIPTVYRKYKRYSFNPITEKRKKPELDTDDESLIMDVLRVYSGFSAYQLELLTHSEIPWIKARRGLPADASCDNVITKSSMREYYEKVYEETT